MANIFNSVKGLHPKLNSFSAHTYRNDLTSQLGVNIPIYQQHVLPGSFVKVSTSALIRLQALIAPIMDNIDFYVHFWKIPYRLLEGDRFTQFISGEIPQEEYTGVFGTPKEFMDFMVNRVVHYYDLQKFQDNYAKLFGNGSLLDYLGYDLTLFHFTALEPVPGELDKYQFSGANNTTKLNFRPLIAYYMAHLNWYMNENVPYFASFAEHVDAIINNTGLSIDDDSMSTGLEVLANLYFLVLDEFDTTLLPHGWDKDYFTSALPNVQAGDPVTISLIGNADVTIPAQTAMLTPVKTPTELDYLQFGLDSDTFADGSPTRLEQLGSTEFAKIIDDNESSAINRILGTLEGNNTDKSLSGTVKLDEVNVITINELRFANALQVFKERQMRYGRRRQEYYKGFFNVTPEDLRLQLPKYLGGGRIPINIADIEQTSQTSGTSALGHLAGKATAVAGGFAGFKTYCSEESIIIGIGFAMPHITYANSTSKFLLKTNNIYDYFNPSFEHLGEQEVLKIELYGGASPTGVFGYTPRYNEYRFHNNELHGEFKNTLAYWTLGRIFDRTPGLNASFIYMQPSVFDRIFAVSGQPSMLCSFLFRQRIVQPVSKYGTPMLLA